VCVESIASAPAGLFCALIDVINRRNKIVTIALITSPNKNFISSDKMKPRVLFQNNLIWFKMQLFIRHDQVMRTDTCSSWNKCLFKVEDKSMC